MPLAKPRATTTKTCAVCAYRFITDTPDYATCIPCSKLRLGVDLTATDHALMDAQVLITAMEDRADAMVPVAPLGAWARFANQDTQ